jgi:hypothetical protein
MLDTEGIDRLLAEAGGLDDDILAVTKTDGGWAIRFEDVDVLAEWDAQRSRLVMSTLIGTPPPERAAEVMEALLSYNALWNQTGGITMALTGPGGDALQFADLAGDAIAARQVAVVSVNLAERARIWRSFLALGEPQEAAAPLESPLASMIRV